MFLFLGQPSSISSSSKSSIEEKCCTWILIICCIIVFFIIPIMSSDDEEDSVPLCFRDCERLSRLWNITCEKLCEEHTQEIMPTLNSNRQKIDMQNRKEKKVYLQNHVNKNKFGFGANGKRQSEGIGAKTRRKKSRWKRSKSKKIEKCETMTQLLEQGAPKLLMVEETHDVTLECNVCPDAVQYSYDDYYFDNSNMKPSKLWYKKKLKIEQSSTSNQASSIEQVKFEPLAINDDNYVLSPNGNLVLEGIDLHHVAEYQCIENQAVLSFYRIDVVGKDYRIKVVSADIEGIHPEPAKLLEQNNIQIYTLFDAWSDCTRCGARGERTSVGHCMVVKIDDNLPIYPTDIPSMYLYPDGIPCRSSALPKSISQIEEINLRKSETLLEYCFEPCPTEPTIKKVTDSQGKVIEVVDTGKGFRSMKDAKPTFPPMVKRKTVYQELGKELIIECLVDDMASKAIRWQNGTQMIDHIASREATLGRVYIDIANRLVIESTLYADSAPYSCWIKEQHIATIKVRIVPSYDNGDIKDKIVYVGVVLTILGLFCVGVSIFKAQRKENPRYY